MSRYVVEPQTKFVVRDTTTDKTFGPFRDEATARRAAFRKEQPTKDMQRQKLYDSETIVNWSHFKAHRVFGSVAETQAFVDDLMSHKYIIRKYGTVYIRVTDGRRRRRGGAIEYGLGGREIRMPVWTRTTYYVLHEIAHHLAGLSVYHHWPFVEVYLDLVRHVYGADAEKAFKAVLREKKVRWKPKATRVLSSAQKEALVARMASVRAARPVAAGKPPT